MGIKLTCSYKSPEEFENLLDTLTVEYGHVNVSKVYDGAQYLRRYIFIHQQALDKVERKRYNSIREQTFDDIEKEYPIE